MPLRRNNNNKVDFSKNPNPVKEGPIVQTGNGNVMTLFDKAKLPMVTLHANQFAWPESFLVLSAKRVDVYEVNNDTGWGLKDENGDKIKTGEHVVRLKVASGDAAQALLDTGNNDLSSLSNLQLTIVKDIPIQKFIPNETLIQLVNPNVMLGFGGQNGADRIILVADDYKEV